MNAIEITGLKKSYGNNVVALKGIDLTVNEGDFFALLGPNGAGKSTAIGILSYLVRKDQGRVSVFGHDLDQEPMRVKSLLGLVPQEFNFNVFEPVIEIVMNQAGYHGIGRRDAYASAEQCLQQLGLWDKRREIARNLSGGMKRRLMIARALVHNPRLLILDEPTAGVDIEIRRSMWKFLTKINEQGTTIVLTTHYLEEAESLCRNLAIIDKGTIIENTDINNLLSKLQVETFLLNLRSAVATAPQVAGYKIERLNAHTLAVEVNKEKSLNQLFQALSEQQIEVYSMRNKSNRLEELFIRLIEASAP